MINRIPLYPYIRLCFLLYLVLPQTQGASLIYTTYVHPYLEDNETQIEDLIATAHDKLKAAGLAYLKRAIELLRTQVFGMPPSAPDEPPSPPASQRPRSYTQALLDRFNLPQARWPTASGTAGNAGAAGTDFYNFLASAMNAAASGLGGSSAQQTPSSGGGATSSSSASPDLGRGVGAFPAGDMTASGTLVPPGIRDDAAKMTFLATQREKLNLVLSALDREAAALRSGATSPGSPTPQESSLEDEAGRRPTTSSSAKSGLIKSRSEADFEKIEAESGAEDNTPEGMETARPTPGPRSGSSWMPWGWGASASTSTSGEKSKEE